MRRRRVGRPVIVGLPILNLSMWVMFPPTNVDGRSAFTRQAIGEVLGSTAVILFAVSLVLATRARWLEPWFGGLDKMYRAHREAGVVGFGALVVHVATIPWRLSSPGGVPTGWLAFVGLTVMVMLSIGPRVPVLRRLFTISYGRWRLTHRVIGVFFIVSLAHVLLVDALVHTTPVPFALLLAAHIIGIAAFVHALLLARIVRPRLPYVVETVRRLDPVTVEVGFRASSDTPLRHRAGQFVFVTFRRRGLREPHPFTVSSASHDPLLRLTVKASGDFTRRLYATVESGVNAVVEGSYGMMDYRRGRPNQVWVAGGIGVTPFLSWCRDLTGDIAHDVEFFYSVRHLEQALFWAEIEAIAIRYPRLHPHLHVSSLAGPLTVDRIAAASRVDLADTDVYMCGPVPMINALDGGLRQAGVPAGSIHFEEFSFR